MDTPISRGLRGLVLGVAVACLLVGQRPANADDPGWTLSLAGGPAGSDFEASHSHRFEPVLQYQPEATGVGAQDLFLEGRDGGVWQLGLDRGFDRRFGGQVLLGMGSFELGGSSSPLAIELHYTSSPPPDYVPRQVEYRGSTPWAEPQGDLEVGYLCINAAVQLWTDKRTSLFVSGGPTLFSVEAGFESLGYETFWQGGHSVLFSGTYELKVESERSSDVGANIGIGIDLRASRRIGVLAEARAFVLPTVDVRLGITEAFRVDENREVPASEIASQLSLEPLHVDPSFASFLVGARVSL